jgi:hypothetical protein
MDKFSGVITKPDSKSSKSEIMGSLVQPEIHTGSIQYLCTSAHIVL